MDLGLLFPNHTPLALLLSMLLSPKLGTRHAYKWAVFFSIEKNPTAKRVHPVPPHGYLSTP